MQRYILAIDAGTTNNRAVLYGEQGQIVGVAQRELTQHYPAPGLVEHDPEEIWKGIVEAIQELLAAQRITPSAIAALGITNQRETTLIWERHNGRPIMNAIVWQDRRTAPICEQLEAEGLSPYVQEHTGLRIDAYFSATKIAWMLEKVAGARERAEREQLCFGTVDSWILWKLSNGRLHCTDYSNASRTMLFDIHAKQWDETLLKALQIPPTLMPKVVPSSGICAESDSAILGKSIPIGGIAGDQQAALFGQGCYRRGTAKNTYGTGCFLLMNIGEKPTRSQQGLLTTIAWGLEQEGALKIDYALEGSVYVAGAVIQWLRDELQIIKDAAESQKIAQSLPDNGDVYLVPAFSGLGTPYWDMYARGTIVGLTRGSGRAHIVRAALESIVYQSSEVLSSMQEDSGIAIESLSVDGGACKNDFILQFQADMSAIPVRRPRVTESTSRGAAFLAGLACGYWRSTAQLEEYWELERSFEPHIQQSQRQQLLQRWKIAVERARGWAQ